MNLTLKIEVPIASFPTSRSREYRETYPVPPPSTVYGMLLSLVGETDRYKHCGVKIALALLSEPTKSITLRKIRRFKNKKIDHKENTRPDFQEILTGIEFIVWINTGQDRAKPTLCDRLKLAFVEPASIERFGALCLGESRDLVNPAIKLDVIRRCELKIQRSLLLTAFAAIKLDVIRRRERYPAKTSVLEVACN